MVRPGGDAKRSISNWRHRRAGRLVGLLGAVLLVAACTEPANDVRSPAPTGSLTPATTAKAPNPP